MSTASEGFEWGTFGAGAATYSVRAAPGHPDSFHVFDAENEGAGILLVVRGLTDGTERGSWSECLGAADVQWRQWFQDQAVDVFYNGTKPPTATGLFRGTARVCSG
ncbi:hypothetical protein [Glycomyces buryatensis]|uniref:Uncharacterized protein n=1 Tax=Glycomyces buryatensis TaxID=2570927 RepID=A0A4S8QMZ6_9ACTN|nr:hypothetical protein [Glycomyces buryatensis]THV42819.1 hypothetical protein FAB82_04245 [Glycomyces buryatensis]